MIIAVLGLIGFVLFFAFIAIVVSRFAKKRTAQWMELARAIGLSASGRYPVLAMNGALGGVSVGVKHVQQTVRRAGAGRHGHSHSSTRTYCEVWANVPHGIGDLSVAEEGVFATLGKLIGAQDIKTGDDRFDRSFIVKGSANAAAALGPKARAALLALETSFPGEVIVQDGAVRWKGGSINGERAIAIVKAATAAAVAFGS